MEVDVIGKEWGDCGEADKLVELPVIEYAAEVGRQPWLGKAGHEVVHTERAHAEVRVPVPPWGNRKMAQGEAVCFCDENWLCK